MNRIETVKYKMTQVRYMDLKTLINFLKNEKPFKAKYLLQSYLYAELLICSYQMSLQIK